MIAAAVPYVRGGEARPRAAGWTLLGGVPAVLLGAYLSHIVGGQLLLVASGLALLIVGWRLLRPDPRDAVSGGTGRRRNRPFLVAASAAVGLFTGLLANGGGFLLVPMYVLVFGLRMTQAAGTSLLVVMVPAIPTLAAHVALGHVDVRWPRPSPWARCRRVLSARAWPSACRARSCAHAFGWFLIVSGAAFVAHPARRGWLTAARGAAAVKS